MKKKVSLFMAVACFTLFFAFSASATDSCELYMGSNEGRNGYYDWHNWSQPVYSYLTKCDNGNYMKVQYGCYEAVEDVYNKGEYSEGDYVNEVVVTYYTSDFEFISTKKIKPVLPIFGAFYETEENYFIISGQTNPKEKADVECFNIAKYDKNWNFIKSVGLKDCNTTIPFRAGTVSVVSSGDAMAIKTSHQMYKSGDGKNHQATVSLSVKMSTMEITFSHYIVESSCGYVSHSFNQLVCVNNENHAVTVDHGDAYPREIRLNIYPLDLKWDRMDFTANEDFWEKFDEIGTEEDYLQAVDEGWLSEGNTAYIDGYVYYGDEKDLEELPENFLRGNKIFSFLDIPGETGDNYTGCTVGGFEVSDSSYIVAGTKVDYDNYEESETKNVFVSVIDASAAENYERNDVNAVEPTATLTKITNYKEGTDSATTPHLVKIDGNRLLLMWTRKGKLYYQELNGKGETVGKLYEVEGKLSDCEPIIVDSKIMWYTWNNAETTFYFIDTADISSYSVKTITAEGHKYEITKTIKEATFKKEGKAEYECIVCGKKKTGKIPYKRVGTIEKVKIKATKNKVTLSWPKAQYAKKYIVEIGYGYWNYKRYETKKTKLTIKNLTPGTTYYIYIQGVNGEHWGSYGGTESFRTKSEAPVVKVKPGKKKATVTFKGVKGASRYEISYSLNKKFKKNVKKVTVKSKKTVKKTISKLRKGKTYYLRVRAFSTYGGKKLYSAYSKVQSVKIR